MVAGVERGGEEGLFTGERDRGWVRQGVRWPWMGRETIETEERGGGGGGWMLVDAELTRSFRCRELQERTVQVLGDLDNSTRLGQ